VKKPGLSQNGAAGLHPEANMGDGSTTVLSILDLPLPRREDIRTFQGLQFFSFRIALFSKADSHGGTCGRPA
jgi:hypothetical protein